MHGTCMKTLFLRNTKSIGSPKRFISHSFASRWQCTLQRKHLLNTSSTHWIKTRGPTITFSNTFSSESANRTNEAFDRNMKKLQRDGAARSHRAASGRNDAALDAVDYDYFHKEIADRLVDRLDDIRRDEGFPLALDIGSGAGHLHKSICADEGLNGIGGIGGIRKLVQLDSSHEMLHRDGDIQFEDQDRCSTYKLVSDEEEKLPFPDGTFDLVMSSSALHWVNNLPRLLSEVKRVLKPDGCFIFAMVGGSTLSELRSSFVLAEMERDGGVSPHVGPFVDFADVGTLLTSAGFALPTIDIDTITIGYPNAMVLMEHLQNIGEGNACLNRRERISMSTFIAAATIYQDMFNLNQHGDDDSIQATVQVIYAIGWNPHKSQQKPLERGSANQKIGNVVAPE